MCTRSIWALLLLLCALPGAAAAEGRRLTLAEAEQLALEGNPSLLSVSARAQAGELMAKAGISRMLPSIFLSEEFQHYDSPFTISFPLGAPDMPAPSFEARSQNTNTFAATASQPLLGLIRLAEDYRAAKRNAAATAAQLQVAQAAVRRGVRVAYIHYFEAKALEEIARQSEKELSEQVTIAQAKLKAGVLTNADVLRVQVALANAQQQEIVARSQGEVARASILITVGISPDEVAELVEPAELIQTARGENVSYSAGVERALSARPELLTARLTVEAAQHQQKARLLSLLPELNVEGGYVRIDGQIFAPANSFFVGLKASWLIWDSGATWFSQKAARAQTESATQDLMAQRRQVVTEVATELSQSQSARSAVKLAEQSIESAAEAYRVTDALVKAGAATTTDLLESQAALTQARLNLARAQYQMALSYIAVQHALGTL